MEYSIFGNLMTLHDVLRHLNKKGVEHFKALGEDEHGLARCGMLDTDNFSIWSTTMPFLVHVPLIGPKLQIIGPTYVVTNRACFAAFVLDLDKNADYAGNHSVDIINQQVSPATVFSTPNKDAHVQKRSDVKAYFTKIDRTRINDYVRDFLSDRLKPGDVNVHDLLTDLLTSIFAIFIGCGSAAEAGLVKRCVVEFQEEASKISLTGCSASTPVHLFKAQLCHNRFLSDDDVIALIKVGFGNLHSMLTSLIYRLACDFPTLKARLGSADVSFDLTRDTPSSRFFAACYVLAPPVWLMGRKVGSAPMEVNGVVLPPHALVLVPWFHILRKEYGNEFNMDQFSKGDLDALAPFSTGANSCIGRYLAQPVMECVIQALLEREISLIPTSDDYEGAVFLRHRVSPVIHVS